MPKYIYTLNSQCSKMSINRVYCRNCSSGLKERGVSKKTRTYKKKYQAEFRAP